MDPPRPRHPDRLLLLPLVDGLLVLDCIASGARWVDLGAARRRRPVERPQKGWSGHSCAGYVVLGDRGRSAVEASASSSFAGDLKRWLVCVAERRRRAYRRSGDRVRRRVQSRRCPGVRRGAADVATNPTASRPSASAFGLDKLGDVDGTVARLADALEFEACDIRLRGNRLLASCAIVLPKKHPVTPALIRAPRADRVPRSAFAIGATASPTHRTASTPARRQARWRRRARGRR